MKKIFIYQIVLLLVITFFPKVTLALGPTITITGVVDGQTYNTSVQPVISVNDANATVSQSLNGQVYHNNLITQDGYYSLVVIAVDQAGNKVTRSVAFTIDTTPPVISIAGVANGGKYRLAVRPNIVVNEPTAIVTKTLDGKPYFDSEVSKDGVYTLSVTATDRANNTTSKLITFQIDRVAPIIYVTGIVDGTVYNNNVTANITTDDPDTNVVTTLNDFYYNSGEAVTRNGSYVLKIVATDTVGNQTIRRVSFKMDKKEPSIDITNVLDGGRYKGAVKPNIVIGDPDAKKVMTLNGREYNGGFIREDGNYTLEVTATDEANNTNTNRINFTIDRSGPEITIENIKNGDSFNKEIIPVITVNDTNPKYSVKLNGKTYDDLPIQAEGDYILEINAVDDLGNRTTKKVKFSIDQTKPIAKLTNVVNEGKYNYGFIPNIKVKEDNTILSMTLNGEEYTNEEINRDGTYVLQYTVRDVAGNETTEIISFSIEREAPVVRFTNIANGKTYSNSLIPTIEVDDPNAHLKYYINDHKVKNFKQGILNDGEYELKVVAVDEYGNESTESVQFVIKGANMAITTDNFLTLGILVGTILLTALIAYKLISKYTRKKHKKKKKTKRKHSKVKQQKITTEKKSVDEMFEE